MMYDVCISFRGKDIRKTFLSHLLYSLDRKGLISSVNYPSQATIASQSRVAIFIISKKYTSLELWVPHLAHILSYNREAVPVFLRVDPLDVLRVLNLATKSRSNDLVMNWLEGHVSSNSGFCSGDWEDESQLVDKITCFVSDTKKQDLSSGDHKYLSLNWVGSPELDSTRRNYMLVRSLRYDSLASESSSSSSIQRARSSWLIHRSERSRSMLSSSQEEGHSFAHHVEPVETIKILSWWDRLKMKINPPVKLTGPSETIESSTTTTCEVSGGDNLSAMKHHVEQVLVMLHGDSTKEVRTVGICGMEGVGKSTLARCIYEEISPQFQHQKFINLSKKVSSLSEIISGNESQETNTNFTEGSRDAMRDMVGRKVLLVADSVDDIEQLKILEKEVSLFGPGSRVVVVTNERSLLVHCGVNHIYEVGCLTYEEAIQLFSHFAYSSNDSLYWSHGLTGRAVEVAGRIPLALKLLGSFLYGKDEDQWERTLRCLEASRDKYSEEAFT